MKKLKTKNSKLKTEDKGFTLIELMVSVTIFSIVMVVSLGAILTILDANRKARTLTEVMNNLNFSLESMTRSIKTGVKPNYSGGVFSVDAINFDGPLIFSRETISYRCNSCDNSGDDINGSIQKQIGSGGWVDITSDQVDIKRWNVTLAGITDNNQPRTQISLDGVVKINDKISSEFAIQTTISQRKLNLSGFE